MALLPSDDDACMVASSHAAPLRPPPAGSAKEPTEACSGCSQGTASLEEIEAQIQDQAVGESDVQHPLTGKQAMVR